MVRHNFNTARFMRGYYTGFSGDLARQVFLEVMVHIAFDAGLTHLGDVRLMSEYTRTLRWPQNIAHAKTGEPSEQKCRTIRCPMQMHHS